MHSNVIDTSEINIDAPLAWTRANLEELRLLQSLQGNILKGHGRDFTANIFFKFNPAKEIQSRRLLRELANFHLTDAHRQLLEAKKFKETGEPGGPFCHLALSSKGYEALGLAAQAPEDEDFQLGMQDPSSIEDLKDPAIENWEAAFQEEIHGLLLVGQEMESETTELSDSFVSVLEEAECTIIHIQRGKALFNAAGDGIEHFGYVDGRSQPLMLVEDVEAESAAGLSRWSPIFPLATTLVKDPGTSDTFSFGSFLVFRKLEQDVRAFKTREQEIADLLQLAEEDRELAGAMIVGRFEDGTPATLSDEARGQTPPNNFNYVDDPGRRCPFHAHIRKVNPRGSGGAEPEEGERSHAIVRRGIPFEDVERCVHPDDLPEATDFNQFIRQVQPQLPDSGVGLLFMAYNSVIANQFKFIQQIWANNTNFPVQPPGPHGIDPVIGQGINPPNDQKLPNEWDNPAAGTNNNCSFSGFVTMKGGQYFFSPSLTFLKNL
jgi:Dyp-type peroxidase family